MQLPGEPALQGPQLVGGEHQAACTTTECLIEEHVWEELQEGGGGGRRGVYGWKPGNYSEFWGVSLQHGIDGLLGTEEPTYQTGLKFRNKKELDEEYDSLEVHHPHHVYICRQNHKVVLPAFPEKLVWSEEHGWCASSWALATTAAMADRCAL